MSNYPNFIASMYISIIAMPLANASDIQIKTAHSVGQGVLYQSNGECYAITPAHVMDGTSNGMALTANRQVHNVTLEHEFSNDIALLRVESPGVCGENVKPLNSLSKVLTVVKNGELLTKLDDASTLSTPIEVTSYNDEFLQIKASDDGRPFKQGFSGSVLFIANSISGLLLEVEDGFGYVYRYDALKEELDEYFEVGIVTDTLSAALISEVLVAPLTKGEVKDFNLTLSTNNPIEFISQPLDSNLEYRLEIFDSNDKRHFSEMYWAKNKYRYAFNPPESGIYTLRFTGKSNHGDFRLETKQYNLDSQLRGEANVIAPGDMIENKLARNSVAEYRLNVQGNSPVEFNAQPLDSNLEYWLEIFDSNDKRHFSEMYWAKNKYRYAFNPPESGIYTLRFTGKSNHGDFRLETKQYNLDSQLRGEANVIAPGDMVENKLARNSVAEYRLNVQGNSPVEFNAQPLDSNLEYWLEIFDSNDKRHFSEMYWAKNKYRYAFNPPESGIYTLRFTGKSNHGDFRLETKQYNLDSQLRGEANVIAPGDMVENKLARNSVAEYRLNVQGNSPIEFIAQPLDSNLEYWLEIFDSNDKRHFSEMYWAKNKYRYAFNPPESGIYTLRFTGKSNHGDFRLETKQYNFDSQLRGEANVIAPGDMVENKLARNSVAEYRLNVQGNSPIEFIAQPLDSNLEYWLEIFDSNDKRHFSEMYWAKNKYRYAFNPPESGIYTLRFTGKSNHGDFRLETKQYNLDSQLRGEANVIAPGDMVENKLARNSVAEYRLNVQGNSPIEFIAQPLDSNLEYWLEIFDSNDKRHFSEMYWAKNKYRYAFNPPESGIYTLRFTGKSNHGDFRLETKQYNLDSQLRGEANVIAPGDMVENKLARNSVAEYRLNVQGNSPIEFIAQPLDSNLEYRLEIFDSNDKRHFSEMYWAKNKYRYAFNPPESGIYTLRFTGKSNHGDFRLETKQYNLDSQLRGEANVIVPGDMVENKLARNSVAEYRLNVQGNSPIDFITQPLDSNLEYWLEIFDSNNKRHFSEMYWAKNKYRYAFNPPESGIYTLRFTGKSNHGDFRLETKQYNLDSQLRGEANVIVPGDMVENKLARNSVAEYRLNVQGNSPIDFITQPLDSNLEYWLEIFDSNNKRHFSEMYWAKNKYRYAFNPPESGVYTLRFTGKSSYGKFSLWIK